MGVSVMGTGGVRLWGKGFIKRVRGEKTEIGWHLGRDMETKSSGKFLDPISLTLVGTPSNKEYRA